MLRRISSSVLNARIGAQSRRLLSTIPGTNIGHLRLSFNASRSSNLVLRARVFDNPTGRSFLESLPGSTIQLQSFGNEVYGPWHTALQTHKPQPSIPPGGLAYSDQGNYLCVFFGQAPAWPVSYFAQIEVGFENLQGGTWNDLAVTQEDPLAMESY